MILDVGAVLAGTIWSAGPAAVVLALLPLAVSLAGLFLRESGAGDGSQIQWTRVIIAPAPDGSPAVAGAAPTTGRQYPARPAHAALREQAREVLARAVRALATVLKNGTR
jgi:hypothetical protein